MKNETQIRAFISTGQLINAIKLLRDTNDLGLWEAKHTVLRMRDEMGLAPVDSSVSHTEVTQYKQRIADLEHALKGMVWAAQMSGEWSEASDAPLGIALTALRTK